MVKHIKGFMLKGTLSSNLGPTYGLLIHARIYIYTHTYCVYIYSLVINVINFLFLKITIALSLGDIPKKFHPTHTHTFSACMTFK